MACNSSPRKQLDGLRIIGGRGWIAQELAAERGVSSAQPLLEVGDEDWLDDDEAAAWIRAAKSDT